MLTHDESLHAINNGNEKEFFDSVFGYLLRRQPWILKDPDGKSRLIEYYEKWRQEYINTRLVSKTKTAMGTQERSDDVAMKNTNATQSEKQYSNSKSLYRTPGGDSRHTSTISTSNKDREKHAVTTSSKSVKRSHSPARSYDMDTHTGATFESYLWNQGFEDLEVRVPVGAHISKGNQVAVNIDKHRILVEIQLPTDCGDSLPMYEMILDGEYPHDVKLDQSTWSLCPKDHISINLEKVIPMWWDRLIKSDPAIDLKNLALERDYNSLPDDEKSKISRIIFEKEQRAAGVKIDNKSKATEMLREAWDKDGSPFKGKPFDPSMVKMDESMN